MVYCGTEGGEIVPLTFPTLEAREDITTPLSGHTRKVTTLQVMEDGETVQLISGSEDGSVRCWDISSSSPSSSSTHLFSPFSPPSPISNITLTRADRTLWKGGTLSTTTTTTSSSSSKMGGGYLAPLKKYMDDDRRGEEEEEVSLLPSKNGPSLLMEESAEDLGVFAPLFMKNQNQDDFGSSTNSKRGRDDLCEEEEFQEGVGKRERGNFSSMVPPPPSMLRRQDTYGDCHSDALFPCEGFDS